MQTNCLFIILNKRYHKEIWYYTKLITDISSQAWNDEFEIPDKSIMMHDQ